jgi:hypothetical protein
MYKYTNRDTVEIYKVHDEKGYTSFKVTLNGEEMSPGLASEYLTNARMITLNYGRDGGDGVFSFHSEPRWWEFVCGDNNILILFEALKYNSSDSYISEEIQRRILTVRKWVSELPRKTIEFRI